MLITFMNSLHLQKYYNLQNIFCVFVLMAKIMHKLYRQLNSKIFPWDVLLASILHVTFISLPLDASLQQSYDISCSEIVTYNLLNSRNLRNVCCMRSYEIF